MARIGLIGGFHTNQSPNADAQDTMNLYQETMEDENAKVRRVLYRSPGTRLFSALAGTSVRGLFEFNGRRFAASSKFYELFADGTKIPYGDIVDDGKPVLMAANQGNQVLVCSGGKLYVFDLAANTVSQPASAPTNIKAIDFSDGYFVALTANSNIFQISGSLDGTVWSGINVAKPSVFADDIVSIIVDHREIFILGRKKSQFYYDSGNTFPYDVVPGGFLEQGCAATFSAVRADNTVFWLGADERGKGIFWRAQGYQPVRVSTHAIEYAWSRYPRIDDCIAYSFQTQGHTFIHLYFPFGINEIGLPLGASWRYDVGEQSWHRVGFWDATNGRFTAHKSQCCIPSFNGNHLVGDPFSGNVYEMGIVQADGQGWKFADDVGSPIRWYRRSPHISEEQQWMYHNFLQVDLETGLGPQPSLQGSASPTAITLQDSSSVLWDVTVDNSGNINRVPGSLNTAQTIILTDLGGANSWRVDMDTSGNLFLTAVTFDASYPNQYVFTSLSGDQLKQIFVVAGDPPLLQVDGIGIVGRDPQMQVRWSDDGGHLWSNPRTVDCGQTGQFKKRAIVRRLGRSRDRVYEISGSDPIPWRILDGYLDADPGYKVTERILTQARKGA